MELVFGITCLAIGIGSFLWVIRDGRRASEWLVLAGVILQLLVISLIFADWGHSWVETSGISIALDRYAWMALPQIFALISVLGIALYGPRFRGWSGGIAMVQTALLIVVMLKAEQKVDLSFLAPVPLISLFASALASFAFLGSSLVVLPGPGSFWYRFVFKPREELVNEIRSLEALGLEVRQPDTVFECGSASGWLEGSRVEIGTVPKVIPARYGLQVRVSIQGTWHGQALPGFAPSERWIPRAGWVEYLGLTDRCFTLKAGDLARFVKELAGVL